MPRPRRCRRVHFQPEIVYFKPAGVRVADLEEVNLGVDELEAVRLKDFESLDQETTAQKMGISQPTTHRLLASARKKIADALSNGKALRIEGGNFKVAQSQNRRFTCGDCGHEWEEPFGTGRPQKCPKCNSRSFERTDPTKVGR